MATYVNFNITGELSDGYQFTETPGCGASQQDGRPPSPNQHGPL